MQLSEMWTFSHKLFSSKALNFVKDLDTLFFFLIHLMRKYEKVKYFIYYLHCINYIQCEIFSMFSMEISKTRGDKRRINIMELQFYELTCMRLLRFRKNKVWVNRYLKYCFYFLFFHLVPVGLLLNIYFKRCKAESS